MTVKRLFIDTETTGTDETKNAVFQIAGVVEIDGHPKEEFEILLRPHEGAVLERLVMIKHRERGITEADIANYPTSAEAMKELIAVLETYVDRFNREDKFFFIGYNAFFDEKFIRAFFERQKDPYYGSWFFVPVLDVAILASQFLIKERATMENFKLHTVARHLGIELDTSKLHDALYDAHLARLVYRKVTR